MSVLQQAIFAALSGGAPNKTYIEDVFSAYTYTGDGNSTQNIANGINLTTYGGLVWTKVRDQTSDHFLNGGGGTTGIDPGYALKSNTSEAKFVGGISNFMTSGYSAWTSSGSNINVLNIAYVSWTFRKAPKFFDVVTWTGDGTFSRRIPHSLNCACGAVFIKRTDSAGNWNTVFLNASGGFNVGFKLNTTDYSPSSYSAANNYFTSVDFNLDGAVLNGGSDATARDLVNAAGATYIAYVFAHDTSADGLIRCGSFATDGNGNASVTLGWEPQFALIRASNAVDNWIIVDAMRGMPVGFSDNQLYPNLTSAETAANTLDPTATGFNATGLAASITYVYMAVRRGQMRKPTSGTQVFNAVARTGTSSATSISVGFPPDLVIDENRLGIGFTPLFWDRLRGPLRFLRSSATTAEDTFSTDTLTSFNPNSISVGEDASYAAINFSPRTYINWFFRRAPGFMDTVCYKGTGVAHNESHNLQVAPELMIVKQRSGTGGWVVRSASLLIDEHLALQDTSAKISGAGAVLWNSAFPTASVFSVGTDVAVNASAGTYIAYLFASLPGISKVGGYTGNGTSQTIPCGFSNGARLILIKRTDGVGDWYIWDSIRGIVAANDPHLSLNSASAEVTTDDSVDPDPSGFIVNQNTATNINVNTATYIFLAIA